MEADCPLMTPFFVRSSQSNTSLYINSAISDTQFLVQTPPVVITLLALPMSFFKCDSRVPFKNHIFQV